MNGPARSVAARVADVRERIAGAAARAGRDPAAVTLVAATKTVEAPRVQEVVDAGVPDLGENRAQELLTKTVVTAAPPLTVRWHFLGQLQRNKVRALAPWVACWQSVDRPELGAEIARRAPGARVLVEVNLGEEPQKGGCLPAQVPGLVDDLRTAGLDVAGLMAVPPHADDPRRWFAALRDQGAALGLPELSMGMTDDFEVAVEEGATIVRVGRALFGPRS
ncbi:MAG TPA: YggS family pyridoxal phosphate-dependent enzyme [Acidimicrobiia bacterium]|nr:YggS family pyridoxal phosphate-dependent enzyme [Acidimicrobiia bacterium]